MKGQFAAFKNARKEMSKNEDFSVEDRTGGDDVFINHELDGIFEVKRTIAGISENKGSKFFKHPYQSFGLEAVEVKYQEDHLPFHANDAKADDFEPTPAKPLDKGQGVCVWCALPRTEKDFTPKEMYMFRDAMRVWGAIFGVQWGLVDMADAAAICEEDGKAIEGLKIGIKFSPREWESTDKDGNTKYGVRLTAYPYPVDQETNERVDAKDAEAVAAILAGQYEDGDLSAEKLDETITYLVEIEELTQEQAIAIRTDAGLAEE